MAVTQTATRGHIAEVSADQREMEDRRHLCRTLMGGTWHMRQAGVTYLPMEPKEKSTSYERRKNRTVLKNYFKKTIKSLVGRVFIKPITVETENPDIKGWLEDIDLQGNHINLFAQDLMAKGMRDGLAFVHVEMPKRPVDPLTGEPQYVSLADMRNGGFRPYMLMVTADRILGWRASSAPGEPALAMIRFREITQVEDGEFGTAQLERIRVLDMVPTLEGPRCRFRVFERQTEGVNTSVYSYNMPANINDPLQGYVMIDSGMTTADHIPFYPFYADREAFMKGFPALEDLAYLNLAHWQSSSDQRNILHVARVPILFGSGFEKDENDQYDVALEVGANIAIYGPENSTLQYVEHQGMAIKAGADDLEGLESEMVTFGLEFMMSRPSHESASARILDQTEVNSPLKKVADALVDCLENALKCMSDYIEDPEEPVVKTNGELGLSIKDSAAVSNLIEMRKEKQISHLTFLRELQRMGMISDDLDITKEVADAKKEADDATATALEIARASATPAPGAPGEENAPGNGQSGGPPEGPQPPSE
jgi:hypothetical protein